MLTRFRQCTLLTGLLITMALFATDSGAQVFPRGNGISLSQVNRVDLYVRIDEWTDMAIDTTEFRLRTQQLFEQKLEAAGVSRAPADRKYLVCSLLAMRNDSDVAYSATLEYWRRNSVDVHRLLWKSGSIATSDQEGFSAELIAEDCAGRFLEEWSQWNRQGGE